MEFRRPYKNSGVTVPENTADYIIYGEDTNGDGVADIIYAKNGKTGRVEFKGTDAASVIQSVVNWLTDGGKVYITPSSYKITSTIQLPSKVILEGAYLATVLQSTTTGNVIEVVGDENNNIHGTQIRNITIAGSGNEQNGIYLTYATYDVKLENLKIYGVGENGVKLERSWALSLVDVQVSSAGVKGVSGDNMGILIKGCNNILLLRCKTGSSYNGFHLTKADTGQYNYNIVVEGSVAESNNNYGLYADYTYGLQISGNFFEGNTIRGVKLGTNAMGVWVAGNYLAPPSSGGTNLIEIDGAANVGIAHNQFGGNPTYNIQVLSGSQIEIFINKWTNGTYISDPYNIAIKYDPHFRKSNTVTFTGDGTTTTFSTAHGLMAQPSKYFMQPLNDLAKNYSTFSADATYLYVNFSTAPPSGSTLNYYWYAEV